MTHNVAPITSSTPLMDLSETRSAKYGTFVPVDAKVTTLTGMAPEASDLESYIEERFVPTDVTPIGTEANLNKNNDALVAPSPINFVPEVTDGSFIDTLPGEKESTTVEKFMVNNLSSREGGIIQRFKDSLKSGFSTIKSNPSVTLATLSVPVLFIPVVGPLATISLLVSAFSMINSKDPVYYPKEKELPNKNETLNEKIKRIDNGAKSFEAANEPDQQVLGIEPEQFSGVSAKSILGNPNKSIRDSYNSTVNNTHNHYYSNDQSDSSKIDAKEPSEQSDNDKVSYVTTQNRSVEPSNSFIVETEAWRSSEVFNLLPKQKNADHNHATASDPAYQEETVCYEENTETVEPFIEIPKDTQSQVLIKIDTKKESDSIKKNDIDYQHKTLLVKQTSDRDGLYVTNQYNMEPEVLSALGIKQDKQGRDLLFYVNEKSVNIKELVESDWFNEQRYAEDNFANSSSRGRSNTKHGISQDLNIVKSVVNTLTEIGKLSSETVQHIVNDISFLDLNVSQDIVNFNYKLSQRDGCRDISESFKLIASNCATDEEKEKKHLLIPSVAMLFLGYSDKTVDGKTERASKMANFLNTRLYNVAEYYFHSTNKSNV